MILFRNEGSIDIRALKTFGLSSKEGQDKIGRFGTGLKYATAVIVRHGGEMTIQTAGETYTIGRQEDTFRGRDVVQLTINGDPLPFTADLGRDWEPWMAFRELYANALDEGGDVFRSEGLETPCGDETVISVSLDAFEAIYFTMEEHFISKDERPKCVGDGLEVYAGRSTFIFYRGVAIMNLKEPAAYRYNLTGYIDLTEDRTAKYDWQVRARLADALAKSRDDDVVRAATDFRNKFESSLDFSTSIPSDVFIGASVSQGANCNPTAMALVRAQLPADSSIATVYSSETVGGKELGVAMQVARSIGADLSECKFVLAAGVKFYGDYEVRGDAVFLNEAIFSDQGRMTLAVVEGYGEIKGKHWLAKRLIASVDEAA